MTLSDTARQSATLGDAKVVDLYGREKYEGSRNYYDRKNPLTLEIKQARLLPLLPERLSPRRHGDDFQ